MERQFVSCSSCGSMFTFRPSNVELRTEAVEAQSKLPGKYWAYQREDDLVRVSWRWYDSGIGCMAVLLLMVLFGTLPVALGWGTPSKADRQAAWQVGIAFSLLIGYPMLLLRFNRTLIEVSPSTGLKIRHGPLPWFFLPRTLKPQDIQQLYAQRKQHKNKDRTHDTYELRVLRPDGSTRHLVGAGLSAKEVLFLERTLEQHLGIEDRAVPGDFKPEGSA